MLWLDLKTRLADSLPALFPMPPWSRHVKNTGHVVFYLLLLIQCTLPSDFGRRRYSTYSASVGQERYHTQRSHDRKVHQRLTHHNEEERIDHVSNPGLFHYQLFLCSCFECEALMMISFTSVAWTDSTPVALNRIKDTARTKSSKRHHICSCCSHLIGPMKCGTSTYVDNTGISRRDT